MIPGFCLGRGILTAKGKFNADCSSVPERRADGDGALGVAGAEAGVPLGAGGPRRTRGARLANLVHFRPVSECHESEYRKTPLITLVLSAAFRLLYTGMD